MPLVSGSAQSFYPVNDWSSVYPASGTMRLTCSGAPGNTAGYVGSLYAGNSGYPAQAGFLLGAGQPISGTIGIFNYAQTQSGGPLSLTMPYTIVLVEKIDGIASGNSSRTITSIASGNGDCHLTLNQNTTESWRQNSTNLSTYRTGVGTHIGIARLQSGRASYLVGSLAITSGTVNSGLKERVTISGGTASGNFGQVSIGYVPSLNGPNTQIMELQLYSSFISDANAHGIYSGAYLAYGGNNLVGSGKLQSSYLQQFDPLYSVSGFPTSIINAAITTSGSQNYWNAAVQGGQLLSGTSVRFLSFQTSTYDQRLFQTDMGQLTQGYTIEAMFRTTTANNTIAGRESSIGTSSPSYAPNIAITSQGNFGFRTFNPPTNYEITSSGNSRVIDNNWHYGVVTVTSGQIKTYLDGVHQTNTTLNSGNILAENYLGGWRMGGYRGGGIAADAYYNGFVGFFRLQSGGLSSGQINDIYNTEVFSRYRTKTFQYTSGLQTFDLSTLPSGTTSLNFFAVGAKGSNAFSSGITAKNNSIGGNGGAVQGTLNISGLANLYIGVGGCPAASRLPVYGGCSGGLAIPADNNLAYMTGGAGGGGTTICGSGTVASGSILVIAGGGGGAGGNLATVDVCNGGNACVPSGSNLFFQRGANGYGNVGSYGAVGGFGGLCSGSPFTSGTIFARGGVPFDANSSIPLSGAFLVAGTGGYNAARNTGGGGGGGFCGGGGGAAGGAAVAGGGAGASFIASGVASGQFFNSYNTTGHGYVSFSW